MDHSKTIELTIPEGKAVKITCGGVTLWMMQSGRIPSEYQEVEWIAAAANVGAYINLGFAYDTAATIYLDQWLNGAKTTTYPFGAANSSGVLRCMLTSPDGESAHTSAFYGSNGVNYGSSSVSNNITNGKNEFVMTIGANVRKLQNLTTGATSSGAVSQTAYTMTDKLYLFAQNYKGSPRFGGERKISAFRYYDKSNALKCDLVPCYRKSDGVIGMYDLVSGAFFTNAGSGSFTKGGNVSNYTNIIDTVGTVDNVRLRSGGNTASAAGFASNYFTAKGGDIIRVSFPNGNRASIPSNGVYCCTYSDTSGTLVTAYDGSTSSTVLKNVTDTGYEIHIPMDVNCSYARVAGGPNGAYADWIVTVY